MGQGGASLTDLNQTPNTAEHNPAARRRVLRSVAERETAQTAG